MAYTHTPIDCHASVWYSSSEGTPHREVLFCISSKGNVEVVVKKQQAECVSPFCVLRLVLDTGERLPCLVDRETWLPIRLATRWAMRYRRYRRQSSTLADNLRILGSLYAWARMSGGFELDDYLTQGNTLTSRQIEAFASTLRQPDTFNELGPTVASESVSPLIDAGT